MLRTLTILEIREEKKWCDVTKIEWRQQHTNVLVKLRKWISFGKTINIVNAGKSENKNETKEKSENNNETNKSFK